LVVFQNTNVQEYLTFVDSWYKERGIRIDPFSNFKKIGRLLEDEYYHESLDKRSFKQTEKKQNKTISENDSNNLTK
jgi:hypothetical protein